MTNPIYYSGSTAFTDNNNGLVGLGAAAYFQALGNGALKIIAFFCLALFPLSACKAEEAKTLQSLPFLAVDLNGNGKIDTIPLEESEVYFDVDGDGLAERTEWISPEDGFIFTYWMGEFAKQMSIDERIQLGLSGAKENLLKADKNKDGIYNKWDYYDINQPEKLPDNPAPMQYTLYQDIESDGLFFKNRIIMKCDGRHIHFKIDKTDSVSGKIICDGTDSENLIKAIKLNYTEKESD